jgi:hypothetical protein
VELGPKNLLANTGTVPTPPAPPAKADVGKRVVEQPAETLVKSAASVTPPPAAPFANPKVAPGLVRWHPDLAAARAAAARSGKPVLLFHLMGKLDDRFC